MVLNQLFVYEFEQESKSTRKILERVPFDNPGWKPHEKLTPLVRLATHIAELPRVTAALINNGEYDVAGPLNKSGVASTSFALITIFEDNYLKAINVLNNVTDDELLNDCTLRRGEQIVFTMPKFRALRPILNHIYHHRAQLGVYLRMLDVPLPFIYGPTADESR